MCEGHVWVDRSYKHVNFRTDTATVITGRPWTSLTTISVFNMNRLGNKRGLLVFNMPHIPYVSERKREIGVYASGALVSLASHLKDHRVAKLRETTIVCSWMVDVPSSLHLIFESWTAT